MNVPTWLKDATATPRGFIGKNGELLKAQRMTAQQCDEFNNRKKEEEPKTITLNINTPVPTVSVEPKVEVIEEVEEETVEEITEEESLEEITDTHGEIEITVTGADQDGDGVLSPDELKALTKAKLESVARDYGIELDRRMSKKKLLEKLLDHIAE
jgi:hypothetical protein